jgi:hypothetical protein
MSCRICFEKETNNNIFVTPCKCKGDAGKIHEKCLKQWIKTSKRNECEICNTPYMKKEVMSFQLKKYMCGCITFQCNAQNTKLFLINFLFSCFFLISASFEDIKIITYISLSLMYCLSIALFLKQKIFQTEKLFTIDSLFFWKFSYTLSLLMVLLIITLDNVTKCEDVCQVVYQKTCNYTCPSYTNLYIREKYKAEKIFIFDLINVGFIIVLRSLVLCPKYNKSTIFSNYHEETEPLIV